MSEEKFIVHIHDCDMTVGEAIKILNRIDYDDVPFEQICAWKLDSHYVVMDASKNSKSVRFDIYKGEE
jgi:predicted nucleic acid-binding protein